MKLSEYQDLYRRLSTAEDIDFLAENFGHDKELLLVIYTQRIVRETTKKFYRVKAQARRPERAVRGRERPPNEIREDARHPAPQADRNEWLAEVLDRVQGDLR